MTLLVKGAKLNQKYALRAIEGHEHRIGGYFPVFTGPDELDSFGQYFTRETNLGLDLFSSMERPLNYRHNLGEIYGGVGKVVHMEVRDEGLWVESELDPGQASYPFIREKLDAGELGYSGETLPNWLKWDASGHVTDFPIFGMAISPNPSAPNGKATVGFVREAGVEIEGEDEEIVTTAQRGIWDFPGALDMPKPQASPRQPLRLTYAETGRQPTRTLNGGEHMRGELERPAVPEPKGADISEVKTPMDRVDLFKQLTWYRAAKQSAHLRGSRLSLPENFERGVYNRFMRSLIEDSKKPKGDRLYIESHGFGLDESGDYVKAPSSFDMFSKSLHPELRSKVAGELAYLRADELMAYDVAGQGDEWVYDAWRTEVWKNIRLEAKVFGLLKTFIMPSNPFNVPKVSDVSYARRVTDTRSQSELSWTSTPYAFEQFTTSNQVFTILDKFGKIIAWHDEWERWSQIDVFAEVFRYGMDMMVRTIDRILINGDETDDNTNISWWIAAGGTNPSATPDQDFLLVLDGLRHHALIDVAAQGFKAAAAFSFANFISFRKKLGVLGHMVDSLVLISSSDLAYDLIGTTEVKTVDVYGPNAVIHTGEVGRYQGVPIIMSEEMGTEYDAAGKILQVGGGTDYGGLLIHKDGPLVGIGWDIDLEQIRAAYADAKGLKCRASMDLQVMQDNTVSFGHDWTA